MKLKNKERIYIWNNPPGNTKEKKETKMEINYHKNKLISYLSFIKAITGSTLKDNKKIIDTFTYNYHLKNKDEKETFEDQPYLIPYLIPNAKKTVIIIPGGGFAYKSIVAKQKEGENVAKKLNKNSINAFILNYRANPYRYPIPYLDLERAVRYLTFHHQELNIKKDKISLIGFSAGAHLSSFLINYQKNNDLQPNTYQKDNIDKTPYTIEKVALIYPVITLNENVSILFSLFDKEEVLNKKIRENHLKELDLVKKFHSNETKQFIVYSKHDNIVNSKEIEKYIVKALQENTNLTVKKLKYKFHGFRKHNYLKEYLKWLIEE